MLTVKNLVKIYDNNKKAVDNISFEINNGEIFGFIGPNGAGKTTTIKAIMGLITFDNGTIEFDGSVSGRTTLTEMLEYNPIIEIG